MTWREAFLLVVLVSCMVFSLCTLIDFPRVAEAWR